MTKSRKVVEHPLEDQESWLNRSWRPAAAVVYLAICLFDFIVAPAFMGFKTSTVSQIASAVKGLDPTIAIALIQARSPWEPLTLQGSGLFHLAFGAILGVAAWTRGAAQIEQVKQSGESDRSPYTPTMVPTYLPPAAYQNAQAAAGTPTPSLQVNVNGNVNGDANPDNPDCEPDKY